MARIDGLKQLQARLNGLLRKAQKDSGASVAVGYTASYAWALKVHEDMNSFHAVGQAKYLEQPAREMAPQLGKDVGNYQRGGLSLPKSLLLAGLKLQRASQLLTPVDTGALKASAYTRIEKI